MVAHIEINENPSMCNLRDVRTLEKASEGVTVSAVFLLVDSKPMEVEIYFIGFSATTILNDRE